MSTNEQAQLTASIDQLTQQVALLVEKQRKQEELFSEMMPIARLAMNSTVAKLDEFDKKGYFEFARELGGVAERVIEGFSPEDVRQLGDAAVMILDTIRKLTQPEVLEVARQAGDALQDADDVAPLGIFGMVRATKSPDVQRGMAVMLEVLRRVGHGINAATANRERIDGKKKSLAKKLGPSRKVLGTERRALPPTGGTGAAAAPAAKPAMPACAVPGKPKQAAVVIDGIAFSGDGHMVDASAWTRDVGMAIAVAQGVELTDSHWKVIEVARGDFAESGVSPNIRRLTGIASVTTKDLYTLFPKAPGRTIAKIAGLPKPAGCL